jgi:hypothetical protein
MQLGSLLTTATQAFAPSCSYNEIHDDDDELPSIPDDWAAPIIATHCHTQPLSAAPVSPQPADASFHRSSPRFTEGNTRDYKWLSDIFAVCIHFIILQFTTQFVLVIPPHPVLID